MLRSIADRVRSVLAWWIADIRRRPSTIGKATSLLIGLFVLCCACSALFTGASVAGVAVGIIPTLTPSPAPTNTSVPTATLQPTSTPVPTDTPVPTETPPPTNTPAPTDTPLPTSTPEPLPTSTPEPAPTAAPASGLTTEERAAVVEIGAHLTTIAGALKAIGELAQNYENTDDWKTSMVIQIVLVRSAHESISEMKVPPKIEAVHSATVRATSDCNAAMDKLVSGLDNNRGADIVAATRLMQSCGQKIGEVLPEVEKLQS